MYKLCGAKARSNGHKPCRNIAMANGRCRLHGGKSTGARTAEGRRRIAQARLKTGLESKATVAVRRGCRQLADEATSVVESVSRKMDLWDRMLDGDDEAIMELSNQLE
jgi:hypothetical protein